MGVFRKKSWDTTVTLKPRIGHLLLLLFIFIAALALRAMMRRDTFPFATTADVARVNTHDARLVELIGDEEGPYRYVSGFVESMPIDKSAPEISSQFVRYQIDGRAKTYLIPTGDDSSTHVNIFENPKGNHLIAVFKTTEAADGALSRGASSSAAR